MKKQILASLIVVTGLGATVAALAQGTPAPKPSTAPAFSAYVSTPPQTLRILPPPPKAGSGRQADDDAAFKADRVLLDQPRGRLATSDANMGQGIGMFACALGQKLSPADTPALTSLMRRVTLDARNAVNPPKDHYQRVRPFQAIPGDLPICVPKDELLTKSASYPSGHSTLSWTWGLILAELAPDRATEVLMRARSIGESRIVCGVHYVSDIEAGRTNGSIVVAALHGDAAFRADMDKARAELASARRKPHVAPQDCQVQDEAAANPPY